MTERERLLKKCKLEILARLGVGELPREESRTLWTRLCRA